MLPEGLRRQPKARSPASLRQGASQTFFQQIYAFTDALRALRNSSIQSKFSIANRWAMRSLIACQNEPSRGLSSPSRLTALSSSSSAARCAARFVPAGVRKSRILSSAVGSLFASNSDDRARDRKASMHVSRPVLITMLNAHTPLGVHYTALVQTARWKGGIIPPLHE